MKRILLLTITAVCLLISCNITTDQETVKNTKIDKSIRAAVEATNEELISALMRNDMSAFKNIASDGFIDQVDNKTDSLILENGKRLINSKFKILDEYYTKIPSKNKRIVIENKARNGMEYTVTYQAINEESYTSLLVVNVDSVHDALLTVVYGKYGPNWLINIIYFGSYSYNSKNAKLLFAAAKKDMKDSNIVDAFINITLAKSCAKPAVDIVKFKCDSAVNNYFDFVTKVAADKYILPFPINTIDTKPEILSISSLEVRDKGVIPLVYYKTKISLDNEKALKAENESIRRVIGTLFKGIDQNKNNIAYRAFNQVPGEHTKSEYFGFLDDLTKDND